MLSVTGRCCAFGVRRLLLLKSPENAVCKSGPRNLEEGIEAGKLVVRRLTSVECVLVARRNGSPGPMPPARPGLLHGETRPPAGPTHCGLIPSAPSRRWAPARLAHAPRAFRDRLWCRGINAPTTATHPSHWPGWPGAVRAPRYRYPSKRPLQHPICRGIWTFRPPLRRGKLIRTRHSLAGIPTKTSGRQVPNRASTSGGGPTRQRDQQARSR